MQATGIAERRFAATEETVAGLGVQAARNCLERAGMTAQEIGFIFAASSSSGAVPGNASSIGAALGIPGVPAIDLPIASAGSLVGIAVCNPIWLRHSVTCW